jgi:arylsulfatase A-like enzyme/Tfp pilus assembly protein PilF
MSKSPLNAPRWAKLFFSGALATIAIAGYLEVKPAPTGLDANFKNCLIVTFDTTRADAIGSYGNMNASTPNLDRMADNGVLFQRCMTVAPITLPSHTSILTGQYPTTHGARNNGTHHVPENVTTLAEQLSDNGFSTGAVVSALVLDSRYGLNQGFDFYDDNLANAEKSEMFMFRETKASDTSQRAISFLKERNGERWFLWVHFFDPHANYAPPQHYLDKANGNPYDGEIAYADSGLGEILQFLQKTHQLDETLVVMTADHGDSMGEHGESTHGMFVYDATTHVPLLMMHPELSQGMRVSGTVSSVDITPTVLNLLDVAAQTEFDGISFAAAIRPGEKGIVARGPVYQEAMNPYYNHGWSSIRAVRDDKARYVRAPTQEFYDMFRDPHELNNLLPGSETYAQSYIDTLDRYLADGERDSKGDDIKSMAPDMRAALAELGYVWSDDEEEVAGESDGELADPKDKVRIWEKSQLANNLVRADRASEAEELLKEILTEDPGSILSRSALAGIYLKNERYQEAYDLLEETATMKGARNSIFLSLCAIDRKMENGLWEEHLRAAKQMDPRDPLPFIREGDWLQDDGKTEGALVAYKNALEIDERSAKALVGIGNIEHRRGNDKLAWEAFEKSIEYDPIAFEAWYNLGVVAESLNSPERSIGYYQKALELQEDHLLTLVNLGNLLTRSKKYSDAQDYYLQALESDEDDFKANYNYGLLLSATHDDRAAQQHFEKACRAEPSEMLSWNQYIRASLRLREFENVLEASNVVLGVTPNSPFVLSAAAASSAELGDTNSAKSFMARLKEVNVERWQLLINNNESLKALVQ